MGGRKKRGGKGGRDRAVHIRVRRRRGGKKTTITRANTAFPPSSEKRGGRKGDWFLARSTC